MPQQSYSSHKIHSLFVKEYFSKSTNITELEKPNTTFVDWWEFCIHFWDYVQK